MLESIISKFLYLPPECTYDKHENGLQNYYFEVSVRVSFSHS